jgi:hypothetical protein
MPLLVMRHDFRAPAFGPASAAEIYGAALEQFRWADQQGWDFAVLSEHHGLDDGWLPAPITMAALVAGMTERIPLLLSAIVVPLHDPVRLAEQLAVVDLRRAAGCGPSRPGTGPRVRDGRREIGGEAAESSRSTSA